MANAKRRGALAAGAALSASALFAANAQAAATYRVTTNGDDAPGGTCSGTTCTTLRDAISTANTDGGADTITFANSVTGTIDVSAHGPLTITDAGGLAIDGPGAGTLEVSGNNASQVFNINIGSYTAVSISGLTITKGSTSAPGGAIENSNGSYNNPSLTLTDDVISGSTSSNSNGGGGIYTRGPLTVSRSTISGNTAPSSTGGGIESTTHSILAKYNVTVTNSTITGNTAKSGGGIAGGRTVSVSGSQITGNHATSGSGYGLGGGLYPGAGLKLTGSTVSGNTSTRGGGGIWSLTKYGTTVSNSRISGNTSPAGGGLEILGEFPAKYNPVLIDNTTISGNSARFGAGIDIPIDRAGNPIDIHASTLTGNQGGSSSFGGGLLVGSYVYSPVKLADSTVSGNAATKGGGVSLSYGSTSPLIGKTGNGSITFGNSTIASNAAAVSGGGIYLGEYNSGGEKSGVANITSTIVSGNTAAGGPQDLSRAPASTSGGFHAAFSLIQHNANAPLLTQQSVIQGVSPQLGPLANNGGSTQTMLPSGTSPVIDQGHAPKSLTTDQRGGPRTVDNSGIPKPPGGDGTDIGSLELPASSVVANFSATIYGRPIGGKKTPLLPGNSTPVKCTIRVGTLSSCLIEVRNAKGKLLGTGEVTTSSSSAKSLSSKVTLTPAGLRALKHHPLGLTEFAKVVGSLSRTSATVSGKVHLLAGPSFTLSLPSSTKLPKKLRFQLRQIAGLLAGAKSVTCTGYSGTGNSGIPEAKSIAKAACHRIKKNGFKGKIKSRGKDTNHRRLVITFKF